MSTILLVAGYLTDELLLPGAMTLARHSVGLLIDDVWIEVVRVELYDVVGVGWLEQGNVDESVLNEVGGQTYSLGQRGRWRNKAPIADNNPQQGKSDEKLLAQMDDGRSFLVL